MLALYLTLALFAPFQQAGTVRVEVRTADAKPVAGASVTAGAASATTPADGVVTLTVTAGPVEVSVTKDGFVKATTTLTVVAGQTQTVQIELVPPPDVEEEVTVVASTRTGRRLEDQPMRVDVLGREEIEEKMLMTPGDIVMMLNEMGGLRVQATSPSLGAASVRIQGMRGRYTRFLSDGLPLFGEQPGGLGLLQIPPMDLGQVEVIKGAASALYGAGAMGGVVNLLSRRPGDEAAHEVLFNQSTRGATDGVLWLSAPLTKAWGFTMLASGHRQGQVDVDDDGWSDMAKYTRGVIRPRVFWQNDAGASFFATVGVTEETRRGGTMPEETLAATGLPYRESLDTTRVDAGGLGQMLVGGKYVMTARAAMATQRHDHLFGDTRERDQHDTAFGEVADARRGGRAHVGGGRGVRTRRVRSDRRAAFRLHVHDARPVRAGRHRDPAVAARLGKRARRLAQRVRHVLQSARIRPAARRRVDQPRLGGSGLLRADAADRGNGGGGTHAPERAAPARRRARAKFVGRSRPNGRRPRRYTITAFARTSPIPFTSIATSRTRSRNLDGATTNRGVELLATYRHEPFAVTGTYTYVQSRESDARRARRRRADAASQRWHRRRWRSRRRKVASDSRSTTRDGSGSRPIRTGSRASRTSIIGLLAERKFGRFSLFINGENLTGVRQSKWDPVVRPAAGDRRPLDRRRLGAARRTR